MEKLSNLRIQDIADAANVAPSTVSHVLNGTAPISPDVTARILAVAREGGYLAKRRRKAAVALLPTVLLAACEATYPKSNYNYVSWSMLNAFRAECKARSIRLIPHVDKGDRIIPENLVAAILEHRPQGVAIAQDDRAELIDALQGLDTSVVILSGQDPSMRVDTVSVSNRYGAHKAMHYLFELGHSSIALLTYGTRLVGQYRKTGFIEAYQKKGIPMPPGAIIDVGDFRSAAVEDYMTSWLEKQGSNMPFTSFFCSADNVAIGAVNALKKAGYRVPKDVSVLGFDNVAHGQTLSPPLSTMHVPMEEIGRTALNLLEEARATPTEDNIARRVELGCRLIVRGSTTGPRAKSIT